MNEYSNIVPTFRRLGHLFYRFFAYQGRRISGFPNKLFYGLLIFMSLFFPWIAFFVMLSLLCHAHKQGKWYHG